MKKLRRFIFFFIFFITAGFILFYSTYPHKFSLPCRNFQSSWFFVYHLPLDDSDWNYINQLSGVRPWNFDCVKIPPSEFGYSKTQPLLWHSLWEGHAGIRTIKIKDLNSTFYPGGGHIRNNNRVYFVEWQEILDVDIDTFVPKITTYHNSMSFYSQDKNNIYFKDRVISVDKNSFKVIVGRIAVDKDFVYLDGNRQIWIDTRGFEIVGETYLKIYFKNQRRVYMFENDSFYPLYGVIPTSFFCSNYKCYDGPREF